MAERKHIRKRLLPYVGVALLLQPPPRAFGQEASLDLKIGGAAFQVAYRVPDPKRSQARALFLTSRDYREVRLYQGGGEQNWDVISSLLGSVRIEHSDLHSWGYRKILLSKNTGPDLIEVLFERDTLRSEYKLVKVSLIRRPTLQFLQDCEARHSSGALGVQHQTQSLRDMVESGVGPQLCPAGDPRVQALGELFNKSSSIRLGLEACLMENGNGPAVLDLEASVEPKPYCGAGQSCGGCGATYFPDTNAVPQPLCTRGIEGPAIVFPRSIDPSRCSPVATATHEVLHHTLGITNHPVLKRIMECVDGKKTKEPSRERQFAEEISRVGGKNCENELQFIQNIETILKNKTNIPGATSKDFMRATNRIDWLNSKMKKLMAKLETDSKDRAAFSEITWPACPPVPALKSDDPKGRKEQAEQAERLAKTIKAFCLALDIKSPDQVNCPGSVPQLEAGPEVVEVLARAENAQNAENVAQTKSFAAQSLPSVTQQRQDPPIPEAQRPSLGRILSIRGNEGLSNVGFQESFVRAARDVARSVPSTQEVAAARSSFGALSDAFMNKAYALAESPKPGAARLVGPSETHDEQRFDFDPNQFGNLAKMALIAPTRDFKGAAGVGETGEVIARISDPKNALDVKVVDLGGGTAGAQAKAIGRRSSVAPLRTPAQFGEARVLVPQVPPHEGTPHQGTPHQSKSLEQVTGELNSLGAAGWKSSALDIKTRSRWSQQLKSEGARLEFPSEGGQKFQPIGVAKDPKWIIRRVKGEWKALSVKQKTSNRKAAGSGSRNGKIKDRAE